MRRTSEEASAPGDRRIRVKILSSPRFHAIGLFNSLRVKRGGEDTLLLPETEEDEEVFITGPTGFLLLAQESTVLSKVVRSGPVASALQQFSSLQMIFPTFPLKMLRFLFAREEGSGRGTFDM